MERNHNPQVVTIATELYKELLDRALHLSGYATNRIDKHARKFNPHLQVEHQAKVHKHESKRREMIRAARDFKEKHVGKTVYARVDMLGHTQGDSAVLLPVIVARVSKDRRLVDVYPAAEPRPKHFSNYTAVSVDTLQLTVPDNYIQGVDSYSRYLVEQGSPYDIKEYIEKRDALMHRTLEDVANSNIHHMEESHLFEAKGEDVIGKP